MTVKETTVGPSSTIEEHLKALFSLDTLDQIEPVTVPTVIGYCSIQTKYTVTLNDGSKKSVFIKNVDKEKTDPETQFHRFQLVNEAAMYKTFIPRILEFVEEHGGLSSDVIRSSFVEFYGNFETEKNHCLVLEDFEARKNKCGLKFADDLSVEDTDKIFKKLGMLYGTFYAWKEVKHPGATAEELTELYPDFKATDGINDGAEVFGINCLGGIVTEVSLIMVKMMTALMEDSSDNSKLKSRCNLEALNRLVNMMPDLGRLFRHLQRTEEGMWVPIFGDAHPLNIALTKTSDEIVFFDFGFFQLSSLMQDFHRFTGTQEQLDSQKDKLLETFVSSFIETTALFNVSVSYDQLMAEYHRTKTMWTFMRYFTCVLLPQIRDRIYGVSEEKEFVDQIKKADITTEAGRADVRAALDKIDYGPIPGYLWVKCVADLVNTVEGDLPKYEEIIAVNEPNYKPNGCVPM